MSSDIKAWLEVSREKLRDGSLSNEDLRNLETLLAETRQMVLYLYAKSTNPCSAIASWALYDPSEPQQENQLVASDTFPIAPKLPSQDSPYNSVMEAMADGWRVVQFPREELHPFSDADNSYLGFGFILEKLTSIPAGS